MHAALKPDVLAWARLQAKLSVEDLADRLHVKAGEVRNWEATGQIPLAKVEDLAEKTSVAFGFLFRDSPPEEVLPISDFRRVGSKTKKIAPSRDLMDVLHEAQRRQDWYREYLITNGQVPHPFVAKTSIDNPANITAKDIRDTLRIGPDLSGNLDKPAEVLRYTIEHTEAGGILVLKTGCAKGDTHRKLSVDEFRGFALVDPYAPLVFVNGADAISAQIFTLIHEIVHIWLGESGVSNLEKTYANANIIEKYCNQVAAEVLVPSEMLLKSWNKCGQPLKEVARLAKLFKVSRLVLARRALDLNFISRRRYAQYFAIETAVVDNGGGGNYYTNSQYRNSRKFSVALITEAKWGRTLYRDAMELLGIKRDQTFRSYAESLKLSL